MLGKSKLNTRQKAFAQEYLVDLNATQAAIRAGYSKKTATKIGYENLTKPDISSEISHHLDLRLKRTQIDADYVLKRLVEIDELDVLDIFSDDLSSVRPLSEWPKSWRTSISGIDVNDIFEFNDGKKELAGLIKKIKWPDKTKNLELIGKHIAVQAFRENTNNTGELAHNIMIVPSCTDISEWEAEAARQQAEILNQ